MDELIAFLRARVAEDAEEYHLTVGAYRAQQMLIDQYESAERAAGPGPQMRDPIVSGIASGLDTAVKLLALQYCSHADYQDAWMPFHLQGTDDEIQALKQRMFAPLWPHVQWPEE